MPKKGWLGRWWASRLGYVVFAGLVVSLLTFSFGMTLIGYPLVLMLSGFAVMVVSAYGYIKEKRREAWLFTRIFVSPFAVNDSKYDKEGKPEEEEKGAILDSGSHPRLRGYLCIPEESQGSIGERSKPDGRQHKPIHDIPPRGEK
jgi:hypothetical protein